MMAAMAIKRKAEPNGLNTVLKKRARLGSQEITEYADDHDDHSFTGECSDTDNDDDKNSMRTVDTPITPFSPSRTVYPSNLKTIPCTYPGCSKMFNRPARLVSHMRSHTNDRPFICTYDDCDKAYTEAKHLTQHVKGTHLQERTYICDVPDCGKSFLTGTRLKRHKDAHQGNDRFKCTEFPPCNQTFRKHQTLQRHIRSEHEHLPAFPCTHIDIETNQKCTAGFETGGALRKHEDRLHGVLRFFCDECKTSDGSSALGFRTKTDLAKHVKNTHVDCLFCDLSFQSQAQLLQHTEGVHAGQTLPSLSHNKFICTYDECGKTFSKKSNLDVHVRTVHSGERFTCGIYDLSGSDLVKGWDGSGSCSKQFMAKINLEDHIRTQHMHLPSIVNAKRSKTSNPSNSSKLAKQEAKPPVAAALSGKAYEEDPARPIACRVTDCQWRFTREYDMEQHIRTFKHGEKLIAADMSNDLAAASAAAYASAFLDVSSQDQFMIPYHLHDSVEQQQGQDTVQLNMPNMVTCPGILKHETNFLDDPNDAFWFGSDGANYPTPLADEWRGDEVEMRTLIDEIDCSASDGIAQLIDPALDAL